MRTIVLLLSAAEIVSAEIPASVVKGTGEAVVAVAPAQGRLRLAITTTGRNSARAAAKNAERTANLISQLKQALGQDAEIRTLNYSVDKNYLDDFVANNRI